MGTSVRLECVTDDGISPIRVFVGGKARIFSVHVHDKHQLKKSLNLDL